MNEHYENGPEGMPRVERMTDSTIMAVLSQKNVPTIYVHSEQDYASLRLFAHAIAEETLARVPAWPAERTTSPVSQMTDEQINTPTWMQALPKGDEARQFVGAAIVYTEDQMISYGHACGIAAELALLQSMKNLAQAIWRSHYRDDSPDFQLLDDCHGVLSQIDNMVTGLVRAPSPDAGRDNPESIRHDRKFDAELDYWVNCVSTKNGHTAKAYGSLISYLDRRQGAAVEQARLDGYNKGVSDMLARIESAEQDLAAAAPHAQADYREIQCTQCGQYGLHFCNAVQAAEQSKLPLFPMHWAEFKYIEQEWAECGPLCDMPAGSGTSVYTADQMREYARAAIAASQQAAEPFGWVQFIDGVQTQNFARDEKELATVKAIAATMRVPGKVEYVPVYAAPAIQQPQDKPNADCSGDPKSCPDNEGYGCACDPMNKAARSAS